jgi:hypothetical protein
MMVARLREELRKGATKISKSDVSSDLQLLEELSAQDRDRSSLPASGGNATETASKIR